MKRIIVGTLATFITLGLLAPAAVHAEDTPSDAPYQETVEEPTDIPPEAPQVEPAPEETSPTLPTVHTSPMTPADPTLQPTATPEQTETAEATSTPTALSVVRPRLAFNLVLTLTPRSMRQSRIWSGF